MATLPYVKIHCFVEDWAEKVHNLGSDTLKICLLNTAPTVATDTSYTTHWSGNEVANGNGYTTGGETVAISSSSQSSGTYTLVVSTDITWTCATANMGTFRYIGLYNDTAASKQVIGYWDHGSNVTLTPGDQYVADISGTTLIQLA